MQILWRYHGDIMEISWRCHGDCTQIVSRLIRRHFVDFIIFIVIEYEYIMTIVVY